MRINEFPQFVRDNYEIHEWRHASAILTQDFSQEYSDICDVVSRFRLHKSHIEVGGGRKSKVAGWIDSELAQKGWVEKRFNTSVTVDENVMNSPTHAVDCYKNRIALEIEWNNKDPFLTVT